MSEISRQKKWIMEEVRWELKLEELEQAQLRKIGALKAERQFWGLAAEKTRERS